MTAMTSAPAQERDAQAGIEADLADAAAAVTVAEVHIARSERYIKPDPATLDEVRGWLGQFVDVTPEQLDVLTVWPAHTHVLTQCFVTTPRLLITSKAGEMGVGKSETMKRVRGLSLNPWSATRATSYAIRAKLGEPDRPSFFCDEISKIFGKSGMQGDKDPLGILLLTGYAIGETQSFAHNLVAEDVSTFAAAAMTGRGASAPDDIRDRSVIIRMTSGRPAVSYDPREHQAQEELYCAVLGQWARENAARIAAFRARGLHPALEGRLRQIWEPLLAIADAAGGTWPRRIMAAFETLALDAASQPVLTPRQTALRDMLRAASLLGGERVGGLAMIDEMRRLGEPLYCGMPDTSLAMLMASAMDPVRPAQYRMESAGGAQVRGYLLADIQRIAAERLPRERAADDGPQQRDGDPASTLFDV